MLTVYEYQLQPYLYNHTGYQSFAIPDGWKPLPPFADPDRADGIILPVLMDPSADQEREVIRFVKAGDDITMVMETGSISPLGTVLMENGDRFYLFLDLPMDSPRRRISHPDLLQ